MFVVVCWRCRLDGNWFCWLGILRWCRKMSWWVGCWLIVCFLWCCWFCIMVVVFCLLNFFCVWCGWNWWCFRLVIVIVLIILSWKFMNVMVDLVFVVCVLMKLVCWLWFWVISCRWSNIVSSMCVIGMSSEVSGLVCLFDFLFCDVGK